MEVWKKKIWDIYIYTLPKTNIAPENEWLKNEISYWGQAYFQGIG